MRESIIHRQVYLAKGGGFAGVLFLVKEDTVGHESFNLPGAMDSIAHPVYLILTCYSSAGKLPYFDDIPIDTRSSIYPHNISPLKFTLTNGAYLNALMIFTHESMISSRVKNLISPMGRIRIVGALSGISYVVSLRF